MTTALTLSAPQVPAGRIAAYLAGEAPLTGLDLYYELEQATSLLELHLLLRPGPNNRAATGLQQSYGDHNRLLLLGLDRLLDGDVAWFQSRVGPGEDLIAADLAAVMAAVDTVALDRPARVALWLGAALHDAGMLCGRGQHVDVEDGVVLGREVLTGLCPPELIDLARFAIRHHDYVKDVFLGEVPAALVADDREALAPALQPAALAVLGMIQVAGSASLGEGRLTRFRVDVFEACVAGTALGDRALEVRAARLLRPATEATARPEPVEVVDDVVRRLLEQAPLHGWHKAVAALDADGRRQALSRVAARWDAVDADHVSLLEPVTDAIGEGAVVQALNGTRILVLSS